MRALVVVARDPALVAAAAGSMVELECSWFWVLGPTAVLAVVARRAPQRLGYRFSCSLRPTPAWAPPCSPSCQTSLAIRSPIKWLCPKSLQPPVLLTPPTTATKHRPANIPEFQP